MTKLYLVNAAVLMRVKRYNKICGSLRSLIHRMSLLPAEDPFRQKRETEMLNKLYDMGVLGWFTLRDHIFAWTDSTAI